MMTASITLAGRSPPRGQVVINTPKRGARVQSWQAELIEVLLAGRAAYDASSLARYSSLQVVSL